MRLVPRSRARTRITPTVLQQMLENSTQTCDSKNTGQAHGGGNIFASMKIKHGVFAVIAIALVAGMFLTGCATPLPANVEGPKSTVGFNGPLKLVAEYKPLHLYIYADVTSTNKHPDYVIFSRNEPLVIANNISNALEVIFCEENFRGQFTTTYDYTGHILRRSYSSTPNHDSGLPNYLYFDHNGDGQWDHLYISGTNADSSGSFVRSNFCWVPVFKK